MATIRELIVELGIEADGSGLSAFEKKLEEAEKAARGLIEEMAHLEKEMRESGVPTKEQAASMEKLEKSFHESRAAAKQFNQEIDKAKNAKEYADGIDKLSRGADMLSQGFAMAAKSAAVFFAGLAAGSAIVLSAVKGTAEYSESVLRAADSLGTTTAKMQQFRFGFEALGASQDDLMDAFGTVTDRAVDAAEGSKTYAKEFRRIGIAVDELKGKKPAELLELVFERTKQLGDETQVVTAMVRLFGDDLGRRLMPALTGSAESFSTMFEMARKAGLVLDKDLIKSGQVAQIAFRKLGAVFTGIWREFGARLAPAFTELANMLTDFIMSIRQSGEVTDLLKKTIVLISEQLFKFARMAQSVYERVGRLNGSLDVMKLALGSIVGVLTIMFGLGIGTMLAGFKLALGGLAGVVGVLAIKIVAVIAAFALLGLILEDIWNYSVGNKSVLGRMAKDSPVLAAVLETVISLFGALWNELKSLWTEVKDLFSVLGEAVSQVFEMFRDLYNVVAALFGLEGIEADGVGNVLDLIMTLLVGLIGAVVQVIRMFVTLVRTSVNVTKFIVGVITKAGQTIYDTIVAAFTGGFGKAFEVAKQKMGEILSFIGSAGSDVFNPFADLVAGTAGAVGSGVDGLTGVAASRRSAVGSARAGGGGDTTIINNNKITVPKSDNPEEFGRRAADSMSDKQQALSSVRSGERS